ncbi:Acyl transferase domain-containing protein [Micromonospora nigra]|uniref:Acyl transferase domain-containing protein n=1 Tax=Micromonospora nigra TaxID=145857 RepID=A0A1C6RCG4_9ACTN|nr:SDR family NAD(P)-dependent oxidoreductase [Micromonospora nigra]SCL14833.1 Acyl transferase domain-containing protein [Micromonospora nigra]
MTNRVETYEKTFTGSESFIDQHRFAGIGVLPASVQVEMAVLAVLRRRALTPIELGDVAFVRPLIVDQDEQARVRLDVTVGDDTRFELSVASETGLRTISTGRGRLLRPDERTVTPLEVTCPTSVDPERLYRTWSQSGLEYGPQLRTVRTLAVGDGTAEAVLRAVAEPGPWYSHPFLVDGVFQVVSCALQDLRDGDGPYPMLPIGMARMRLLAELPPSVDEVTVRVHRTEVGNAYSVADAVLLGPAGEVVIEFTGIRMRRVPTSGQLPRLVTAIRWTSAPPAPPRPPARGTWVVLHHGHPDDVGGRTVRALRGEGARVVEVVAGPVDPPAGETADRRVVERPDDDWFRRLWSELADPVEGVVHLWNTGAAREEADELRAGLHTATAAIRTLAERHRRARFLVGTDNAQPVRDGDRPEPARAALWGLVRTAAIEYPGLRPRLVDLDSGSADALIAELGDGPVEVGYRHGVRHVPQRVPATGADGGRPAVRRGGRYLILGGHGGLGLAVAARFARDGAGLVALVSRSGGTGVAPDVLAAVEASGCTVVSYAVDVTAPESLAGVVRRIEREHGPLHGVVHAAGTLRDGLLRSATEEDLVGVLRPKVDGVRALAAAFDVRDLDFAVLFASVSGTFGNLGQGGYAAANAYLDAYAHAHGRPWISVDWGLWGEVGMGTAVAEQLRRRGVRPLGTVEALDALTAVLRHDLRQVVVAHPDVSATDAPPPTAGPATTRPERTGGSTPDGATGEVDADDRARRWVEDDLARFLAERLEIPDFDRDAPLSDYGMNSILSVELTEELSRRWNVTLPATLFLEYGDFAELAQALVDRYAVSVQPSAGQPAAQRNPAEPQPLGASPAASAGSAPTPPRASADTAAEPPQRSADRLDGEPAAGNPARTDIAVVAVSADLPGASDLDGFWEMLRAGRDAFTDVPADRWDVDALFEERGPDMTGTYCRTGAFVSDIDRFDPRFFGVSLREAEEMDPQQKLLLEHAWSVVDESGLAGRRDIGVFVGATYTHHRDAQGLDRISPHTALGSMNAVLANRISYALDLTGPSQTVDTLCSSALVAVQQAVLSLRAGQCGAAIVAACHVGLTPWYYRSLSQLGALSPTRPRPFDERADGFVPGEGAIAVMLRPLADAVRDGDRIWGVIRGAAVNHGGRGSALPVPRSEAQAAVVRAALADAGLSAADLSLVETHGTATRLGDPIEIAALTEVFGAAPDRTGPCYIGSVKANIGHLEPASGLAGLLKVLLCIRHREIPPLAGFEVPGSHVDLSTGRFVVPTEAHPWPSDGPRRAGISAFGMGGTNAHVVVEEYVAELSGGERSLDPSGEHLLVLSAHTPQALVRRAGDVERLIAGDRSLDPAVLCFAAAVGRRHLAHRLAVLGATADELGAGLRRALGHGGDLSGLVVRGATVLTDGAAPTASTDLVDLAFRHVGGGDVDWRKVHGAVRPPRLALPPYPFRTGAGTAPPTAAEPVGPRSEATDDRVVQAHRVFGEETVPAALVLDLALSRGTELESVTFTARGVGRHLLTVDPADAGPGRTVSIRHGERAIARLTLGTPVEPAERPDRQSVDELRARYPRQLDPAGLYAWFAAKGMDLDGPLRAVADIRFGPTGVLARIEHAEGEDLRVRAVAALDAALQSMAVLTMADPSASAQTYLPVSAGRVVRWADPAAAAFVHLHGVTQDGDGARRGTATLLSADGTVLVTLDEVAYRPVPAPVPPAGSPRPASRSRSETPPARVDGEDDVVALVRRVLRDPTVTATSRLSDLGMDSMLATEIAAAVAESFEVGLSPTDVLDARDCRSLAAVIGVDRRPGGPARNADAPEGEARSDGEPGPPDTPAHVGPTAEPESAPDSPVTAPVSPVTAATAIEQADPTDVGPGHDGDDIAIIGMACAVPGATDPNEFWSMLSQGTSGIGPAPEFRWGAGERPPGGFLDGVEEFDAQFFDFFPKQAEVLDPQARWLLRTTWEALESAGVPPLAAPRRTGVFVGASYQHYKDHNIEPELDAPSGLGNHNAFLANRVSYFLDLSGPSMTIDTLCSSSLVALHTAVRSLRNGECDQAVVAGVRLAMSPLHYHAMRSLRALSPTGASRAFDASADGFVPGEGVVTVVLKPLRDALRDGDRVRAVVKGSAVNHGGRTSGLTVPSSAAQAEVVGAALRDAGVDPVGIQMVEAHGTGTGLGDPIEVEGLSRAWRVFTDRVQFCGIGSLKSNVGHLEPAAGLAGVVKVVLALENGVIPPTLHVVRPNDHIRFEESPFFVVDRPVLWPRGGRVRRGAVSAFGMGGVNAHVVVEEAPVVGRAPVVGQDSFVVRVSAASEDAVRVLAGMYADRFARSRDDRETADLCHTANVGRSPLAFQTAVRGTTAGEIAQELRAVAAGHIPVAAAAADDDVTGLTADLGAAPLSQRHAAVVDAVRRGQRNIDWPALSAPGARITDLPTYPFARHRYWRDRTVPPTASTPPDAGRQEAYRTEWHADDLAPGVLEPGITVRVVAADRYRAAMVGALLAAGARVVADDSPAARLVVVDDPSGTDADLETFWARLRSLLTTLPAGARMVWATWSSAAVQPAERITLLPTAAARAAAVRAACAENRHPLAVLDLDPREPVAEHAARITAELAALQPDDDTVAAYRRGTRLVPVPAVAIPGAGPELSADGYYLVTGGLGAVGQRLAEHLVVCGARRIAVLGRSAAGADSPFLTRLGQQAEVAYLPCDVQDERSLADAVAHFGERWGRLRGVVHCAGGVNPFGAVKRRDWADAARVTGPKVAGSHHVLRVARGQGAEFVVLVSSIAGVLPDAGRGLVDYAMANAYQLALAEREDGADLTVTAHAWPNWLGVGMAADKSFSAAHSIGVDQALAVFAAHLRSGGSVVVPGGVAPAEPVPVVEPANSGGTDPTVAVGSRAAGPDVPVSRGRGNDVLAAAVRAAFMDVLGEAPDDRSLDEMGLDSLAIADLTSAIERRSGVTVDPSMLMRARTAADIAARLATVDTAPDQPATGVPTHRRSSEAGPPAPQPAPPSTEPVLTSLLRPLLAPASKQ